MSNEFDSKTLGATLDTLRANKIFMELACVHMETSIGHVVTKLNQNSFGLITVLSDDSSVIGVVTDGDIRRLVIKTQGMMQHLLSAPVSDIMSNDPKIYSVEQTFKEILDFHPSSAVLASPVIDFQGKYIGTLDILRLLRFIHL